MPQSHTADKPMAPRERDTDQFISYPFTVNPEFFFRRNLFSRLSLKDILAALTIRD